MHAYPDVLQGRILSEIKSDTDQNISLADKWDAYADAEFLGIKIGFGKIHKLRCFREIDKVLEKLFISQPDSKVLDAGCGDGMLFKSILKGIHPGSLVGADLSPKMLARAKGQKQKLQKNNLGYFKIQLTQEDLSQGFPWEDDCFDAVVSNMFTCFLPVPWQIPTQELYRITKHGGHIYHTTFLQNWDFSEVVKKHIIGEAKHPIGLLYGLILKKHPSDITEASKKAGLTYPTRTELCALLKKLGAKNITEKKIMWDKAVALRIQVSKSTITEDD